MESLFAFLFHPRLHILYNHCVFLNQWGENGSSKLIWIRWRVYKCEAPHHRVHDALSTACFIHSHRERGTPLCWEHCSRDGNGEYFHFYSVKVHTNTVPRFSIRHSNNFSDYGFIICFYIFRNFWIFLSLICLKPLFPFWWSYNIPIFFLPCSSREGPDQRIYMDNVWCLQFICFSNFWWYSIFIV